MKFSQALEYLRSRSDRTKTKIAAVAIVLTVIILGGIWMATISNSLGGFGADDLSIDTSTPNPVSDTQHVIVEAADTKNGKTYIYFKLENPNDDILNLPKADGISIQVGNRIYNADAITNRQNQPFPVKALNQTTNYGIVTFPEFNLKGNATMTFDNMSFEHSNQSIFKEHIDVDLSKLGPIEELRS